MGNEQDNTLLNRPYSFIYSYLQNSIRCTFAVSAFNTS